MNEQNEAKLLFAQSRSIGQITILIVAFCVSVCQCVALSLWTVDLPASVKALEGSCVAIPCSFDYPSPGEEVTQFTGIWTDESGHVIYHPDTKKAMAQYRNRTNLLGDLLHKDCSLKIDPVQASDKGPYHFRIEIHVKVTPLNMYRCLLCGCFVMAVDLEPVGFSVKEEVLQDDSVSAKCSVSHSCPPSPPHISWTHSGHVQVQHQEMGGALWRTTSTITFQPRRTDHKRELQCTVTHSGGRQQNASKVLSVKYNLYIYIGAGLGAAVLILILLIVVVARKWYVEHIYIYFDTLNNKHNLIQERIYNKML
uniref:Ig-like domain-containing protein n=1 Tax=Neogobius melanostomus TaxID=47308 RepID=A0A8C6SMX9_9GOBI